MRKQPPLSNLNITHGLATLAGVICLALLAEVNGEVFKIEALRSVTYPQQFGLLVAGCSLLGWGLSGAGLRIRHTWPWSGHWLVWITLLAFAVRVWNLENAVHFYVDEGNFAEGILSLREQPYLKLLSPFDFVAAFTWVYPVMQHGATALFGSTLFSLRIISVIFGTLTIPAVYQLGRVLYDRRIGLLAAFLLAVLPPHIHFSRLGLNNIADPLFGTLALAFLARAMQQGRRRDYVLAGIMLGLTQYFYEGGRLLYPPLVIAWVIVVYWTLRPRLQGLLLTGLIAVIVSAPVYYAWIAWDVSLTTRLNRQGVTLNYWTRLLLSSAEDGLLASHLRDKVLMPMLHFISVPDQGAFFYGGHTALILPPLVPAFLVGIGAAVRRHVLGGRLLILWLVFTVLGNSLVQDSVWTSRYVVALPAVVLLLALGFTAIARIAQLTDSHLNVPHPASPIAIGEVARPTRRRGIKMTSHKFLKFLLLLIAIGQIIYYFGPHLTAYQLQVRSEHDQQDIAFRAFELPENTRIYLVSDDSDLYLPLLTILYRYWGRGNFEVEVMHPFGVTEWDVMNDLWWGEKHAFFVERNDRVSQDFLREKLGFDNPGADSPFNVPLEKQYRLLLYEPPLPGD